MKLIRIMTALTCEPWLIRPDVHAQLLQIAFAHANGGRAEVEQHMKAAGMSINEPVRQYGAANTTAMSPVEGVIGRKFSNVLQSSGVVSVDVLQRVLRDVAADPAIDSAVLVFDSPGGVAQGVKEAAQDIANLNTVKPVIAYADGRMQSAAYWLASQASAIYATPSADIGSIGAYLKLLDQSGAAEKAGIKVEMFRSGKHKGMGEPGTSLTDEQRVMLQERIDRLGEDFRATVRAARPGVSDDVMDGRSFGAEEARVLHLIDTVASMDDAIRDAAALAKNRRERSL